MRDTCKLAAVVLAAGRGKRMKSELPKVLHEVDGQPMIQWVVAAAKGAGANPIVLVVGHGHYRVKAALSDVAVKYVLQREQLGTAHAVEQARPLLENFNGAVVVLSGDVPGIKPDTIKALCRQHQRSGASATMLTAKVDDPTGYGRVMRDPQGHLLRVVEEKDANDDERAIREVNSGIYVFETKALFDTLPLVSNDNKQNEYYLPDVLYILREQNQVVAIEKVADYTEILGVNTKLELRRINAKEYD